jgi:hypothetical protein
MIKPYYSAAGNHNVDNAMYGDNWYPGSAIRSIDSVNKNIVFNSRDKRIFTTNFSRDGDNGDYKIAIFHNYIRPVKKGLMTIYFQVKGNNTNMNNTNVVFRIYYAKNGANDTNRTTDSPIYSKTIYGTTDFKNGRLADYSSAQIGESYVKHIKEYKTTISEFNPNAPPVEGEWVYEIALRYDPNVIYRTGTDEKPDNMYTVIHVYGSGGWSYVAINLIDIVYGIEY